MNNLDVMVLDLNKWQEFYDSMPSGKPLLRNDEIIGEYRITYDEFMSSKRECADYMLLGYLEGKL